MKRQFFRIFQISLLVILSFCVFSCAKFVNGKLDLVAPEASEVESSATGDIEGNFNPEYPEYPEESENPNEPEYPSEIENLDEIGEFKYLENTGEYDSRYNYCSFGIFPQRGQWRFDEWDEQGYWKGVSIFEDKRWSDMYPYSTLADGDKYYLGSDGSWYERVLEEWYDNETGEWNSYFLYYKVEPIVWRIVEFFENELVLVPVNVLTSMEFYNFPDYNENYYGDYDNYRNAMIRYIDSKEIYPNNYKYSQIRAYLNNYDGRYYNVDDFSSSGFLTKAFTALNRNKLLWIEVDNSVDTTKTTTIGYEITEEWNEELGYWGSIETPIEGNLYVCENTFDRVFLLSYSELENGFLEAGATDYARNKGCSFWTIDNNSDIGFSTYYTRSPWCYDELSVTIAGVHNEWDTINNIYTTLYYEWWNQWCNSSWCGTLPAIVIKQP